MKPRNLLVIPDAAKRRSGIHHRAKSFSGFRIAMDPGASPGITARAHAALDFGRTASE